MSALTVFAEDGADSGETTTDFSSIRQQLQGIGVQFERWIANCRLPDNADQETVIAAYRDSIDRLQKQHGFESVDVVNLSPDHPDKSVMRQKFLAEHVHDDFEVRFFIDGKGLFYLHVGTEVYVVLCEKGDLISVPAKTRHWFDMGENPHFKCIRLFTSPDGWVASFTGSEIAKSFPTFDQYTNGL